MTTNTKIDVTDIQGFVLKGYNFPLARYLLLELVRPEKLRISSVEHCNISQPASVGVQNLRLP